MTPSLNSYQKYGFQGSFIAQRRVNIENNDFVIFCDVALLLPVAESTANASYRSKKVHNAAKKNGCVSKKDYTIESADPISFL